MLGSEISFTNISHNLYFQSNHIRLTMEKYLNRYSSVTSFYIQVLVLFCFRFKARARRVLIYVYAYILREHTMFSINAQQGNYLHRTLDKMLVNLFNILVSTFYLSVTNHILSIKRDKIWTTNIF